MRLHRLKLPAVGLLAVAGLLGLTTAQARPRGVVPANAISDSLVINELDYDQPGTDYDEFIELRNVGASSLDLDGYYVVLVNGGVTPGAEYDRVDLPGVTLPPGGRFVVCGGATATPGTLRVPNCDLPWYADTNWIQNGAPDAIAVVANPTRTFGTATPNGTQRATLAANDVMVDALSYEGNTTGGPAGGGTWAEGTGVPGPGDPASGATVTPSGPPLDANKGFSRPDETGTPDTDDNRADLTLRCTSPGQRNLANASDCPDTLANTPTDAPGTVTVTPAPTETPAITLTPTPSPTDAATDTATAPPVATDTPAATDTATASPTAVPTDTPAPTDTPLPTLTATDAPTATATVVATDTAEPTPVPTETATTAASVTPVPSGTPTSPPPTASPTDPPTATSTATPPVTETAIPLPTDTVAPPPSATPLSLPVQLVRFGARRFGRAVFLSWATESEVKHAGFRVWRENWPGAPTPVAAGLIPARGGALSGAAYRLVDWAAPRGAARYWLEAVSTTGASTRHGPALVGPAPRRPIDPPWPRYPGVDTEREAL